MPSTSPPLAAWPFANSPVPPVNLILPSFASRQLFSFALSGLDLFGNRDPGRRRCAPCPGLISLAPLGFGFRLPTLPQSNHNGWMTTVPFDLKARAHQAMLAAGFQPDFPAEVVREVQARKQAIAPATGARDLRSLPWSSIDNDSSPGPGSGRIRRQTSGWQRASAGGDCRRGRLRPQRVRHGPARRCGVHFGLHRRGDLPDVAGLNFPRT